MGIVLGRSLGTKPCVFLCKVAKAGDERYLLCAAGAATIVSFHFVPALLLWPEGSVGRFVHARFKVFGNLWRL